MITVAGLFAHVAEVRQAVLDLVTSGVPHEDISIVMASSKQAGDADAAHRDSFVASLLDTRVLELPGVGSVVATGPIAVAAADNGLLQALTSAVAAAEPAQVYLEAIGRGHTLLVVQSNNERADVVHGVFRHNHVLDGAGIDLPPEDDPQAPRRGVSGSDLVADEGPSPLSTSIGAITGGLVPGGTGPADTIFDPGSSDNR